MIRPPRKRGKAPPIDCFACETRCHGKAAFARHLKTHNLSDADARQLAELQTAGVEAQIEADVAMLHAPSLKPSGFVDLTDLPDGLMYTARRMIVGFGEMGGSLAL
jgi:hypothetical protein